MSVDRAGDVPPARFPLFAAPKLLIAYLLVVESVAAGWVGLSFATQVGEPRQWTTAATLVILAIGFDEASTRVARLRLRIGPDLKTELTSVWSFAAAVALPGAPAVVALVGILLHTWLRQERPAGEHFYRMLFNNANVFISCFVAASLFRAGLAQPFASSWGIGSVVAIVVALAAYAVVNRVLVTGALVIIGVRGHDLIGSREDNTTEAATLCLGALVALAVELNPLLAALVLLPLIALQRGAVVGQLERAASMDPKTGLLNAVAWEQVAQRECARAQRTGSGLAVLMVDIDRFKPVNDRYGHLVGDLVLKALGRCLLGGVRDYDTVGRFGGEEFLAVLPDADDVTALAIAERLRERVQSMPMGEIIGHPSAARDVLTISIGVASLRADGGDLPELLHAADVALYRAKALGRNQVQLAQRGGEQPRFVPSA